MLFVKRHLLELPGACDGVAIARGNITVIYWHSGTRVMTLLQLCQEAGMCTMCRLTLLMCHRGQLNIIKQPVKLIRSVHCHLHFPVFCVCRAPEPMGTLSLTSVPGLWAEPGVKMGSWALTNIWTVTSVSFEYEWDWYSQEFHECWHWESIRVSLNLPSAASVDAVGRQKWTSPTFLSPQIRIRSPIWPFRTYQYSLLLCTECFFTVFLQQLWMQKQVREDVFVDVYVAEAIHSFWLSTLKQ